MSLNIRFYNDKQGFISEKLFPVSGNSSGWQGSLGMSTFDHRRETVVVPPRANRLMVVISSAGPPSTIGVYVVDDLNVFLISPANGPPQLLLHPVFDAASQTNQHPPGWSQYGVSSNTVTVIGLGRDPKIKALAMYPPDWIKDGDSPNMATVLELDKDPKITALAIIDDDPNGHAEWRNPFAAWPKVVPGDKILLEWNELYNIGEGEVRWASYRRLPPGNFTFHVQEENVIGIPTGVQATLAVRVALPLWEQSWFWISLIILLVVVSVASARYHASLKFKRELLRLKQQRALEQERLRIAQDIHDDLGARVTQISLFSAMAPDKSSFPENARADFGQISQMSRDLIAALYETVWAVNPENDSLYALGNYLRQMTSQLCDPIQLPCRFRIPLLPRDVHISSQTRHNIVMAVKEAVNNTIKHARATELGVHINFTGQSLTISIQDNGCGFQTNGRSAGHGMANLSQRMKDIGGNCIIESRAGPGTCVKLHLIVETTPTSQA